jgi:iron complex outermembrane receptor protein
MRYVAPPGGNIVEATLQGGLFDLPAGEVRMAAGLNYRHDSYDHDPDAVWRSGDLQGLSAQFPSGGSHDVTEIFAEVLLPLVRNAPLMEKLDLDLGYRFSDYSTIGSVSTYKADVEWTIKPWAQLRGGYSRAIRAPSLGELFAPRTPATVVIGIASPTSTNGDPCDVRSSFRQGPNAAAVRQLCLDQGVPLSAIDTFTFTSVNIYADAVGNPDLEEEKADTYSVGLILPSTLETPWLSRLQFSVDYYSITIDDAIGRLPFATGLLRCFNGDGISNPTYDPNNVNCVVVARNAVGTITGGLIPTLNLASYETRGVDFQLDWAVPLDAFGAGSGDLRLHMVANRLLSFDLTSLPGAATLDYAGYSSSPIASNVLPKWKATSSLSFVKGGLNLGVRWRYIGATKEVSRLLTPTSTAPGPDAYNYFDLFGSFDVNDTLSIRGGVSNLTDKKPPQIGTALGNTDISTYDLLGTSFYLGLRATF